LQRLIKNACVKYVSDQMLSDISFRRSLQIERDDLVAALCQSSYEVPTNEPGAACHEYAHGYEVDDVARSATLSRTGHSGNGLSAKAVTTRENKTRSDTEIVKMERMGVARIPATA